MHHLIDTEKTPLTRELALHFSRLPSFKGDRERETPAGQARIAWLGRLMREGKFHTPKWATAEVEGAVYRVNGGHSSQMLAGLNGDFPRGLFVIIDRFRCDSRDDLADLFDQFDQRRSIRTTVDKIKAHRGCHDELDAVSPTDIGRCLAGIAYYMSDDGQSPRLEEEERIRLIHEYREFILWASQWIGRGMFSRVGTVAGMFATWTRSRQLAAEFWTLVAEESHPDNRNATRTFAVFLRDSVAARKTRSISPKWCPRAMYVKTIHAWNAWRRNMTTDLRYHELAPLPRIA